MKSYQKKVYENEKEINSEETLNVLKEKLASKAHYTYQEKNGTGVYFYNETGRVVAIAPSDRCIAVCANTRMDDEFNEYVVKRGEHVIANCFNPSFLLVKSGEYDEDLLKQITLICRILKSSGGLNLYCFEGNHLIVGEFAFEERYKVSNPLLYDQHNYRHRIKSIAAISRKNNKVSVLTSSTKGNFKRTIALDSITLTGDHSNFAYLCEQKREEVKKEFEKNTMKTSSNQHPTLEKKLIP